MPQNVVLFSNRSLLAAGVRRLLEGEEVKFSILEAQDPDWASKMKEIQPGVILLDSGDRSLAEGVITRLLATCPKAKVVGLNTDNKSIDIYQMSQVPQTDMAGLLEAIGQDGNAGGRK
ncbi:MAG: hypothetical protein O3A47_05360 [Chloroflexi bacterium]|nr:hypothetical protein [Chloroflexota bacterium]